MSAPRSIVAAASIICARCGREMETTFDAIGRGRERCRHCDGIAPVRRHPDDAMIPQGLVRALPLLPSLPPIAPGQLRCQRCARGVPSTARFCAECAPGRGHAITGRVYALKRCSACDAEFQPSGPRSLYCEACR